jgi:NOL1/NOP2/fmu family ribosome biogenesis protein
MRDNDGARFERLPPTAAERTVAGRATRREVVEWWTDRFGFPADAFDGYTFWEKGAGRVWAFAAEVPSPVDAESLGLPVLRTRQEHWKPTTDGVQRFGHLATENVLVLDAAAAARFVDGRDQELAWDGDWGYLIAAHDLAGGTEPIGVGLYLRGELRSMVPKSRRRQLD